MMYKIKCDDIGTMLDLVAEKYKVYAPLKRAGETNFAIWDHCSLDVETLKTVRSAKEVFFPCSENIVEFKSDGKSITVRECERMGEDFVVFGVRACDARSFKILDSVFLADPVDTFYEARRKHGIIISLACNRPEETCFCKALGIDAAEPEGDITACLSGEWMYLEPKTEKGLNLIKAIESVLEKCDGTAAEREREGIRKIISRLPLSSTDLSAWGEDGLLEKFNSPKWAKLSEACLGCGACTFVCPTCQCYDVRDYENGKGIQRFRCWDSCMYKDFTMMAHGTPRPTQMQRFRQRFMHKLVYHPSNHDGVFSCVGCGRCLEKCPMGLNIIKVIKAFGGNENE